MKTIAWAVLTLGLVGLATVPAAAQEEVGQGRPLVELERNYPNPFSSQTTIPFALSEELWADGNRPVVTVRIYNVLAQLVAIPVLQGTGEAVDNIQLDWNGTGQFAAAWDGTSSASGRDVASGIYVYQLSVNGRTQSKRMTRR
jgi:hypothetical protein